MFSQTFKAISQGIRELLPKNCNLQKNDKFPTLLAAILDIG